MEGYTLVLDEDNINLTDFNSEQNILFEQDSLEQKHLLMKALREDYMTTLREEYKTDDKLFDMVGELLEESEDQTKLMQIIDTL